MRYRGAAVRREAQPDITPVATVIRVVGGLQVVERYVTDRDALLQASGASCVATSAASHGSSVDAFTCDVCMDDVDVADTFAMPCGHRFCASCWVDAAANAVADGELPVACLSDGCTTRLGVAHVAQIATSPEVSALVASYRYGAYMHMRRGAVLIVLVVGVLGVSAMHSWRSMCCSQRLLAIVATPSATGS